MHLPQVKVLGYNNVIDVAICLSSKEFPILSEIGSFESTGETWKLNNDFKAVHAWINIDQLQTESKTPTRLGFGKKDSKQDKENGIYYMMTIEETGEGRTVKGSITYTVVAVDYKGKKYKVNKDFKLPNGTQIQTTFTETYHDKSTKNSTLFKFTRKLVNNGLLQFSTNAHLEPLEAPKKVETPKKPKAASVDIDKSKADEKPKRKRSATKKDVTA